MKLIFLTWSTDYVISSATGASKFYAPVVTLSTQDNAKLSQWLKSGFERTINSSKYESEVSMESQNRYLYYLIDPSFQGVK